MKKLLFATIAAFLLIIAVFSLPINAFGQTDAYQQQLNSMLASKQVGPSAAYIARYLGPTETTQYEWPQAGYNASTTFYSPCPTAPRSNHVLWTRWVPNGTLGGPAAVFNGKVFISAGVNSYGLKSLAGPATTYCLEPNTGRIIWAHPGGGVACKLDATRVLCGSECLDVATGSTLWKLPLGSYSLSFPIDVPSKRGFVAGPVTKNGAKTIQGYDFSDLSAPPKLMWTSDPIETQIGTLAYNNGKVYVISAYQMGIWCLAADTGKIIWHSTEFDTYANGWCIGYGRIFGTAHSGAKFCVDANTGKTLWVNYGQSGGWLPDDYLSLGNGLFYCAETKGYTYALDVNDGHVVWKYRAHLTKPHPCGVSAECWTPLHCGGSITTTDTLCYAVTQTPNDYPTPMPDGNWTYPGTAEITCFDAHTGEVIWRYEGLYAKQACGVVSDGRLYGVDALRYTDPMFNSGKLAWCFGEGPTSLSVSTDKTQVKIGETVRISGCLKDLSPASLNAPAANVPINLSCDGQVFASVLTDKDGKFTYNWTPPQASVFAVGAPSTVLSIVASSTGSDAYIAPEDVTTPVLVESVFTPISGAVIAVLAVAGVALIIVKHVRKSNRGGLTQ